MAQGMQSVMYIHCCSRAEIARCVETTVCYNCAQQTGTIDTCQGANAHWATPHFSGRRSSLLKRVRFGLVSQAIRIFPRGAHARGKGGGEDYV